MYHIILIFLFWFLDFRNIREKRFTHRQPPFSEDPSGDRLREQGSSRILKMSRPFVNTIFFVLSFKKKKTNEKARLF